MHVASCTWAEAQSPSEILDFSSCVAGWSDTGWALYGLSMNGIVLTQERALVGRVSGILGLP